MYNVFNKSDVFYLYDFSTNQTQLIGNRENLIAFIANAYRREGWSENRIENKYFKEINMGNDIYYFVKTSTVKNEDDTYDRIEEKCCSYRRYMFYDGYDRVVDIRLFEDECRKYYHAHKNDKRVYRFNFRRTQHPKSHARNSYKHTFTHNRMCVRKLDDMFENDMDYKDYHFKKLEDPVERYPDWWDDTHRRVEGNWKSQYKVNKQHNIHNKGKSDDTIRKMEFDEFSDDDIDAMLYEDFLNNFDD